MITNVNICSHMARKERVITEPWYKEQQDGCLPAVDHCRFCGQEIRLGEAYYELGSGPLCAECLPLAAPMLLLPFRRVAGERD